MWSGDVDDEPLYRTPPVRNGVSKVDQRVCCGKKIRLPTSRETCGEY